MTDVENLWAGIPEEIRDSLEALRAVPEPDPEIWEKNRRSYSARIRQIKPQAVTPSRGLRHKNWRATLASLLSQFSTFRKEHRMASLMTLFTAVSVVLALGVGAVSAAPDSLPGSPIYPLKIAWEDFDLSLAGDPVQRIQKALDAAQNRLQEVHQLIQHGEAVPENLALAYQNRLQYAFKQVESLDEPLKTQVQTQMQSQLTLQQQYMQQLMAQLQNSGETGSQEQMRMMMKTLSEVQSQLQLQIKTQMKNQLSGNEQSPTPLQNQNQMQNTSQGQNQQQTQEQNQQQNQTSNQQQNQTQSQQQVQNQPQNQETHQTQNQEGTQSQEDNQQNNQHQKKP